MVACWRESLFAFGTEPSQKRTHSSPASAISLNSSHVIQGFTSRAGLGTILGYLLRKPSFARTGRAKKRDGDGEDEKAVMSYE